MNLLQKILGVWLKKESPTKPTLTGRPGKFKRGSYVQHRRSGNIYFVLETPEAFFLEATGRPAYSYRGVVCHNTFARDADEMEDGRFSLIKTNV